MLNDRQLAAVMRCKPLTAASALPHLLAALAAYRITDRLEIAHLLGQIDVETGGLRYSKEIWGPTPQQLRYETRRDLGNTQPGDGRRFRGHGWIQVTGRYNHAKARDRMRAKGIDDVPDFEVLPHLLAEPRWAALSACDYWTREGLREYAMADDAAAVSRGVNLGNPKSKRTPNHLAERIASTARAKRALGVP